MNSTAANWRPRNETDADLERERTLIAALSESWGLGQCRKLSETLYGVDFAMFDESGTLYAWAEVKCYSDAIRKFAPLSLAKYSRMLSLWRSSRRPAYLVLHTPEGVLAHQIVTPDQYATPILTGNPRGQNGDSEPCLPIRREQFHLVMPPLWGESHE